MSSIRDTRESGLVNPEADPSQEAALAARILVDIAIENAAARRALAEREAS